MGERVSRSRLAAPTQLRRRIGAALIVVLAALAAYWPGGSAATASDAPTVTGVAITSDAGDDDTYALGDTITITVTFSAAVDVTGAPQLRIDMDPADWGTKVVDYQDGSGTASLTFEHEVIEPNYSTRGIAVLANSLALNGGSIRSASSQADADLSHDGLAHDAGHRVNWQLAPPAATPTATPAPSVTGVAVTSDAGDDDTYALGETITITVTFSEAVDVTGTPQLKIDMDPAAWGEKVVDYTSGSGTASLTFEHEVVQPNYSTRGIAVLANSLALDGGSIRSASSQADADLSHDGLAHDANHKVNWQLSPEANRAPVVNTDTPTYESFVGEQDAPRGVLVSKSFAGLFSDPDGDELTYAVSISGGRAQLVEDVSTGRWGRSDAIAAKSPYPREAAMRVFLEMDGDDDWKAVSPALPDPVTIVVTLTATDPDGRSVSLAGDFVTDWESHPALVSAAAVLTAVALAFDLEVQANPAPPPGRFTVNVVNEDGSAGTVAVSGVSVNGKVVTLHLASALESGQTVTLDYTHDDAAPLKRAAPGGDSAPGFTGRAVDVSLLDPPTNFVLAAEAGKLDLTAEWDAVEGATSYRLRWRQDGGDFRPGDAITVADARATITVSGYGRWEVRLQGCNDAGCGPEATSFGTADSNLCAARPPGGVTSSRVENTITVSWETPAAPDSCELTGFIVDLQGGEGPALSLRLPDPLQTTVAVPVRESMQYQVAVVAVYAERTPEPETAFQRRAPLQRAPASLGLRVSPLAPDPCKESPAEHGVDWRCRR